MRKLLFLPLLLVGSIIPKCYSQEITFYGSVIATGVFTTSGDAFLSTTSGRVGISSMTPQSKLGVEGGIIASSSITAQGGFYGSSADIAGNINGSSATFSNSTRIGATTSNDSVILTVDGSNYGYGYADVAKFQDRSSTTSIQGSQIYFNGNLYTPDVSAICGFVNYDAEFGILSSTGIVRLVNPNGTQLSISSYNYIGIGTITPTEKLDVNGNIKASGTFYGSASGLTDVVDSDCRLSTGTLRNETITSTASLVLADRTFTTLSTVTYMTSLSSVTYMRDLSTVTYLTSLSTITYIRDLSTITYVVNLSTLDYVNRTNFNLLAASTGTVDNSLKLNGHTYDTFVDTYTAQNIKGIKTHLDDIVVGNTTGDNSSVFLSSGDSVIDFADKGTSWGSGMQEIYSKDGNEITVKIAGADRVDFKASTTTVNNTLEVITPTTNKNEIVIGTNTAYNFTVSTNGQVNYSAMSHIRVYRSGTQSIPNAFADTQVLFNTVSNDTLGEFNVTSSSVIVKYTGYYYIAAQVTVALDLNSSQYTNLKVNGSVVRETGIGCVNATFYPDGVPCTGLFYLNAGDTVSVSIIHNSLTAKNLDGTQKNCFLEMYRVP